MPFPDQADELPTADPVLERARTRCDQLDSGEPLPLTDAESIIRTYGDAEAELAKVDQYRRFTAADGFWTNVAREEDIPQSRTE